MDEPEFLDTDDVLELHRLSLESYGGLEGVRDAGMLASAIGQPQTSFDGAYAHDGLFAMDLGGPAACFLSIPGTVLQRA